MGNSTGFLRTLLIKEGHRCRGDPLFEHKAAQLFCPTHPHFIVANTQIRQSSSPEDAARINAKNWFTEAHDLLKHHWSEIKPDVSTAMPLADFDWDNPPKVEISYAQAKAEKLWGEYFAMNLTRKSRLHMKCAVLMGTLSTLLDMDDSSLWRKC